MALDEISHAAEDMCCHGSEFLSSKFWKKTEGHCFGWPKGARSIHRMELVVGDFLVEYPDMISVIKLSGLLHSDDNCALKEVARQLCLEHQLQFSKAASFDDNSQFMVATC
ncbi:hypothetical protein K1719_016156 [Acacia pycnantha]|nr:hypothetical protein K1719_016156 [Acacia pycnantha]